jgi:hypothetical protein
LLPHVLPEDGGISIFQSMVTLEQVLSFQDLKKYTWIKSKAKGVAINTIAKDLQKKLFKK